MVVDYIAGLASRDVTVEDFKSIILGGKAKAAEGDTAGFTFYGLRG